MFLASLECWVGRAICGVAYAWRDCHPESWPKRPFNLLLIILNRSLELAPIFHSMGSMPRLSAFNLVVWYMVGQILAYLSTTAPWGSSSQVQLRSSVNSALHLLLRVTIHRWQGLLTCNWYQSWILKKNQTFSFLVIIEFNKIKDVMELVEIPCWFLPSLWVWGLSTTNMLHPPNFMARLLVPVAIFLLNQQDEWISETLWSREVRDFQQCASMISR